jgi:hypothetical protein
MINVENNPEGAWLELHADVDLERSDVGSSRAITTSHKCVVYHPSLTTSSAEISLSNASRPAWRTVTVSISTIRAWPARGAKQCDDQFFPAGPPKGP